MLPWPNVELGWMCLNLIKELGAGAFLAQCGVRRGCVQEAGHRRVSGPTWGWVWMRQDPIENWVQACLCPTQG